MRRANELRQTLRLLNLIYHARPSVAPPCAGVRYATPGLSAEAASGRCDGHFADLRSRVDAPQETHETRRSGREAVVAMATERPPGTVRSERLFPAPRRRLDGRQSFVDMYRPCGGALNVPLGTRTSAVIRPPTRPARFAVRTQAASDRPQGADLTHTRTAACGRILKIPRSRLTSLISSPVALTADRVRRNPSIRRCRMDVRLPRQPLTTNSA